MQYRINEGTFPLPAAAQDRSVNMLVLNLGPGGLSLVVTREAVQPEDALEELLSRQLRTLGSQVKELKQHARREVAVGPARLAGIQINTSFKQNNVLVYQWQTLFSPQAASVLTLTLSSASPLNAEQQAYAEQLLAGFIPA